MGNDIQIGEYRANSTPVQVTPFSTLYRAKKSITSDREYLIKMITTENELHLDILKYEKEIHERLDHPNIVKLLDYGIHNGFAYLAFDFYIEGDVTQHFDHRKPSRGTLDVVFGQVLDAVIYCHDMGVVHRDVKLENVIVTRASPIRVALTDFGFARFVEEDERLTENVGSANYVAPEVQSGVPYDGKKVDVWSLCVMYYYMVNDSFPFDDTNPEAMEGAAASYAFSPSKRHQSLFESVFIKDFVDRPSTKELKSAWMASK